MGKQHVGGLGTLLVLVALTGSALAQQSSPPQIEQVRVGLPSGGGDKETGRVRPGAWAPVYLKIKPGRTGNVRDEYHVLIQATDAEGALYTYPVPVPALEPNKDHNAIGYVRPSNNASDVKVFLRSGKIGEDGQTIQTFPRVVRDSGRESVAPPALFVLALGSRLGHLKQALAPQEKKQPVINGIGPDEQAHPGEEAAVPDNQQIEDEGARRFASIESVDRLPDQWFGYDAVDLVVLTTGSTNFVKDLLEDTTHRREALLEWVRRGGRLILSVERNAQLADELLKKMSLLNCSLKGSLPLPRQANLQTWMGADDSLRKLGKSADLQPGPQTHVILREGERAVLIQGACGMGRVILVGFDLDLPPFTDWSERHRKFFWNTLLKEMLGRELTSFNGSLERGRGELLSTELQRNLESFDVPVIHFGWVTLFILIYILIVGPLDYFVLKKVFKRLELTWITFPTLVILISVLAYLIAYKSKGDDLRINKIDLVEYDLSASQAYGRSWFSVFSPHVRKYTLGQDLLRPEWVAPLPPDRSPIPEMMLATMAINTDFQQVASRGLFPQPYAYAEDAEGVRGVPIPVWATRTFTTSWHAPLNPDKPAIEARVSRSRLQSHLPTGEITNNLPVALEGLTLFYEGHWYNFDTLGPDRDTLAPGQSCRIDNLFTNKERAKATTTDWLQGWNVLRANRWDNQGGGQPGVPAMGRSNQLIKALLFHAEALEKLHERDNGGLRLLDQTWRLKAQTELPPSATRKYRPEIILVARTALASGPAKTLSQDGSAPTRLWLGNLPDKAAAYVPPEGQLNQETYVRVYIPLGSEAK